MNKTDALLANIEAAIRSHAGNAFTIDRTRPMPGEAAGKTVVSSGTQERFFVKFAHLDAADRFEGEADGLQALRTSTRFRVPTTIDCGSSGSHAWLILEHLRIGPVSTVEHGKLAAEALVELHSNQGEEFGWHRDNYIGDTPQENGKTGNWSRFFALHRLKPQFERAAANGYGAELTKPGARIIDRVPAMFLDYRARPCLVHGDLWHGNIAITDDGRPALYDPAAHYGDHEVDLAMTELFGGLPESFYATYRAIAPLAEGHHERKTLYNLYHMLNHLNLFGRSYLGQVKRMTEQLSKMLA